MSGLPRTERKLVAVGRSLNQGELMYSLVGVQTNGIRLSPTANVSIASHHIAICAPATYPEASSKVDADCKDRKSAARERSVAMN